MGAHDTGWIRVMGLIMGVCRGPWGMQHGLDQGDGLIYGIHHGHTTGSGKWD